MICGFKETWRKSLFEHGVHKFICHIETASLAPTRKQSESGCMLGYEGDGWNEWDEKNAHWLCSNLGVLRCQNILSAKMCHSKEQFE